MEKRIINIEPKKQQTQAKKRKQKPIAKKQVWPIRKNEIKPMNDMTSYEL